jgi:Na+-transporting methylmalonyl-CoA/oxaloacetate decarboxylase gamma subunit
VSDPALNDLATAWKLTCFGMAIVFTALSLVSGAVALFQRLERRGPAPEADEGPSVEAGIPPEVVAAISAAVLATAGERTRIHHIRYRRVTPETTWTRQGRISIMASHRIR